MSISYKTRWQEAQQQVERLQAEIDRLLAFIQTNRHDLAQTRPIVDLAGIARHMRVARYTPQQWAQRGLLPPVDFPEIKGEPLWYASTIQEGFARPTGRAWYDGPDDEEGLSPAA